MLVGVVLAIALAACTEGERRSTVEASSEGKPCRGGLAEFLEAMRQITYDYEPADTPADLARQAHAVVTGTIVGVRPGQSYAPGPGAEAEDVTSVIEVTVDEVVAGDRALVSDGSLYIEVLIDHADFPTTVPRAYGVFFVSDRTDNSYTDYVVNEGAGRPAGARLTATFVQGFLLENGCGKLVSVWVSLESMRPAWRRLDLVAEVLEALP